MSAKAIIAVGKQFSSTELATEFLQSKLTLTSDSREDMDNDFWFWAEGQIDFPEIQALDCFQESLYIGFNVHHKNPETMIKNIQQKREEWKTLFGTDPEIISQAITY